MKTNDQLILEQLEILNKKIEKINEKLLEIEKEIKKETLTGGFADSIAFGYGAAGFLVICFFIYSYISSFFS